MTRALPVYGKSALSKSDQPAARFSTVEMARASARASPERRRSIRVVCVGAKQDSVTTRTDPRSSNLSANRSRVLWLVQPDLATSGENNRGQAAPAHLLHRTTLHFLPFQRLHRRLQVVAHEVQFVQVVLFGRMKRSFCGRQRKDEPAVTSIHRGKLENIAKESAIAFRILAVDDGMSTGDQGSLLLIHGPQARAAGARS